jgi:hypothetical protein
MWVCKFPQHPGKEASKPQNPIIPIPPIGRLNPKTHMERRREFEDIQNLPITSTETRLEKNIIDTNPRRSFSHHHIHRNKS